MDDLALIRGALAGRHEDFEILVERYQKMLYAFAHRYLRDADAAAEAVHISFVKAYTHLGSFRGSASFKTWLHQIALNECRNRRHAGRLRREVPLEEAPEALLAFEDDDPDAAVMRATLERLIARLPERQRAVLTLRTASDLSFGEIARIEGISENAAKVNYFHAVQRLKQWLTSGGGRQ